MNSTSTVYKIPVILNKIWPPIFVPSLPQHIDLTVGEANSFQLPGLQTWSYLPHTRDPITVTIPSSIKSYLSYDSADTTIIWSDDEEASWLVGKDDVTLSLTV